MRFIQKINQKKFTLISVFLFLYVILNLLDGERGLISYYGKLKIKESLEQEKKSLIVKIASAEKRNSLLTDNLDLDYLEIMYREKFMVGKSKEKIYKIN